MLEARLETSILTMSVAVNRSKAYQTGVLRLAMLLSDHRSILLRPRRVPEADDAKISESKSVTMADAEGSTIVSKSQNLSYA